MMVSVKLVVLLSACLHAALCLPLLQEEAPEVSRQARSVIRQLPLLDRLTQDGPLSSQWETTMLGEDAYPSSSFSSSSSRSEGGSPNTRRFLEDQIRPRFDFQRSHRRPLEYTMTKRNEEANIPTMGLGVLSNMRKFFNELRTNLDSVEEAAALSQELGTMNNNGPIDPANFLALLARHGARSVESQSGEAGLPQNPTHMRRLMFGYNHDDQPYAHSGLGK